MLDTQPDSLRVRPVYIGPACYYTSRVGVGVRAVATRKARKIVASLPVALLDVSTDTAFPRSVAGIDEADLNAGTLGLVNDLALQVCKGPRVQDASLLAGSPYPKTDALDVFEGDTAPGAFSHSDNLLGNNVIDVFGKSSFFSTSFYKKSFGTFCSFPLQLASKPIGTAAKTVEVSTRKVLAVAGSGDVDHADINTEPVKSFLLFNIWHVYGDKEVELLLSQHQVSFPFVVLKQASLRLATDKWHALAAIDRPNTDFVVAPRQNSRVVRYCSKWAKNTSRFCVKLVGVCDFGNATHDYLRAEINKFSSAYVITEFVKVELSEGLSRPSTIRKPVTSRVGPSKRAHKHRHLLYGRPELDLHCELHTKTIAHSILETRGKERRFLPALKDGVSSLENR